MDEADGKHVERAKLSAEILLQDAQEAMQIGDCEGALDLLQMATEFDPGRIELHGHLDGVRSQLLKRYRERIGDVHSVPRVVADASTLSRFNLPSVAGFVLSLVDGATSVEQIVAISGMDAFEVFRILNGLTEARLVAVDP